MEMMMLILLTLFLGLLVYQLMYNPYIHLVVGSLMTDVQNFFKKKKSTRTRKK